MLRAFAVVLVALSMSCEAAETEVAEITVLVQDRATGEPLGGVPVQVVSSQAEGLFGETGIDGVVRFSLPCSFVGDSVHLSVPRTLPAHFVGLSEAERAAWLPRIEEIADEYAITFAVTDCTPLVETTLYASEAVSGCGSGALEDAGGASYLAYMREYGLLGVASPSADGVCVSGVPAGVPGVVFLVPNSNSESSLRWIDVPFGPDPVLEGEAQVGQPLEVTVRTKLEGEPLLVFTEQMISHVSIVRLDGGFIGTVAVRRTTPDRNLLPNGWREGVLFVPPGEYYVLPGTPFAPDFSGLLVERAILQDMTVFDGHSLPKVTLSTDAMVELDVYEALREVQDAIDN